MLIAIKGSLRTPLFLLLFMPVVLVANPAADSLRWHSLLHFHGDQASITDPGFLLSLPDFSPKAEWIRTIELFKQDPKNICIFPARYLFMSMNGEVLPPVPECPEYDEFLSFAPADSFSVVYASENLVNPSSMLGHGMLSFAGMRADGYYAQHSVSFFTELDSLNPLKVIWETFVEGKPGFFLVKPLNQHYEFYNLAEQRNVWRYELDLSELDRKLLHAHIWELRDVNMDYFFHTRNCATVSANIVRIVIPDIETGRWVTPIDLVKAVNRTGRIKSVELKPAAKWQIKMLSEVVSKDQQDELYAWQQGNRESVSDIQNVDGFLERSFAEALVEYRQQTRRISDSDAQQLRSRIPLVPSDNEFELILDDYRSPLKTPEDAHWSFGYQRIENTNWINFEWLAVGHGIEDDNRQYFSENELKLFELSVRASPDDNRIRLNHLTFYSARSLDPWDRFTGGISGAFRLGVYPFHDDTLTRSTAFNVHGGLGLTRALSPDFRVYTLANIGWYRNNEADFLYVEPEVGAYLYEVFDMKSWLRYQPRFALNQHTVQRLTLTQSWYWTSQSALIAEVSRYWANDKTISEFSISFRHYF